MKKSTDWPFWNGDLEKFAGKPFEGNGNIVHVGTLVEGDYPGLLDGLAVNGNRRIGKAGAETERSLVEDLLCHVAPRINQLTVLVDEGVSTASEGRTDSI